MKTEIPLDLGEEFVGGTSANSAFVLELSDNVLRQASRIRENKNNEKAQGQFLEYLKGELNKGMPVKTSTDRRRLIAQLKDFFRSKSTEEAYTFLFRALFNETIEIRYPGDDLLRVSDGNFLKQSTIRINERGVFQLGGEANVVSGNALVIGSNTDFTDFSTSDYFKIGTQQAVVSNVINATHMLATTNFTTTANNQFVYKLIPTDIFQLKNKTIRGKTSGSIGVVADVRASTLGGKSYADLILRLISGSFEENEIIEDIDNPSSNVIVYGVVSSININDGGTGYAVDDVVVITGDGLEATAKVTSVSEAPITKIVLANTGIGYQNNLNAVINNTGTGGTGFAVRISEIANTYAVGANNQYTVGDTVSIRIVNRGSGYVALPTITLQDTAVASLGLLHDKLIRINNAGTLYEVGDALVFTNPIGFSGNTAVGRVAAVTERWAEAPVILVATEIVEPYKNESLLDDFGSNTVSVEGTGETEVGILVEGSYYDRLKTEDWRAVGPIERLELTYSANGNYAFGNGYSTTSLPTVVVTSANGVGANLEVFNIQGKSAVINIDASNNIAGIGSIREVTILNQGIDYTTATIDASAKGDGNANLTAEIGGLFVDSGRFTNDDGKVNFKILQDSLFYQDFSYVIRSGLSFDQYKEIVKEVVHPAGLEFFGEIVITSTISLAANFESQFAANKAPRFASLFSFFSLFKDIGFPPANQQSIVVRIKPFVSYTDNAKLDTHREINLEIAPTVITVAALTSTEYRPTLIPSIDVGVFGSSTVEAIPVSPGQSEFDIVLAGISASVILDTGAVREVDITPATANLQISWIAFEDLNVPKLINLNGATLDAVPTTEYEIDILSVNTADRYLYGELPILELDQTTIAELMDFSFEDYYHYGIKTPTLTLNLLDIDIPMFTSLPITVYESETFGNNFTYKLNANVVSQEHREIVIQPVINIPSTFFIDKEFIVKIQNSFDATMAFYSIVTTAETDIRTVEIDVNLLQNMTIITHDRIVIQPVINIPSTFFIDNNKEFIVKIQNSFDATMAFYSDIVTLESEIKTVEITIPLSLNASSNITSVNEIDVGLNPDKFYEKTIEEFRAQSIGLYDEVSMQSRIAWGRASFDSKLTEDILYKDTPIFAFEDEPLTRLSPIFLLEDGNRTLGEETMENTVIGFFLQEQGITFNDIYSTGRNIAKNKKIPGTVNVTGKTIVGTGTNFTENFFIDDYIIIESEKFIIKQVSNSTYMEVNVTANTNYTDVPAYREYFV